MGPLLVNWRSDEPSLYGYLGRFSSQARRYRKQLREADMLPSFLSNLLHQIAWPLNIKAGAHIVSYHSAIQPGLDIETHPEDSVIVTSPEEAEIVEIDRHTTRPLFTVMLFSQRTKLTHIVKNLSSLGEKLPLPPDYKPLYLYRPIAVSVGEKIGEIGPKPDNILHYQLAYQPRGYEPIMRATQSVDPLLVLRQLYR